MFCVICKTIMRFDRTGAATERAMRKRLNDLQYKQANDAEIWDLEQNKPNVEAATALRETDPKASFSCFLALAESGSVWSMLRVADAYESGTGTERDLTLAEEWLLRAAEQGSDRAILTYCWLAGPRGNIGRCVEVCRLGAARGWPPALYWLARYRLRLSPTRTTFNEVYPLIKQAAAQGDLLAENFLTREMMLGRFGVGRMLEGYRLSVVHFRKMKVIYNELTA